jgi:hypothetical protein
VLEKIDGFSYLWSEAWKKIAAMEGVSVDVERLGG